MQSSDSVYVKRRARRMEFNVHYYLTTLHGLYFAMILYFGQYYRDNGLW